MRRCSAPVAVGVVLVVALAAPAGAKTTVKVNDNDVTITVPIDCVGCKGKKAPDGTDLATYWKKTAEDAWNKAFKRLSYCNKYKFTLVVDIESLGSDFDATKGRHRILVGLPGSGLPQTGWNGLPETTPGGDPAQASPDGTRYFKDDGDGSMASDAPPTVIIHEFGHVLGLGDDRDAQGNALPNRGRTVMIGGSRLPDGTVVFPDTQLKIDKQLVDRIGDQLANLGKINCGTTWKGTLKGSGDNIGICADVSHHNGDFTIRDRGDGTASLAGHMVNTAGTGCGAAGRPETTEAGFRIEGERTRGGFSFPAGPTFPFPMTLAVRREHATGTSTVNPGGDGVYTVTLDFDADCEDCDDEAVG